MENHLNGQPTKKFSLRDYYNSRVVNEGDSSRYEETILKIRNDLLEAFPHFFISVPDPFAMAMADLDLDRHEITYDDLLFFDGISPETYRFSPLAMVTNTVLIVCSTNDVAVKLKFLMSEWLE